MGGIDGRDPKAVNRHGHEIRPYYSTGIGLPLLIGVVDAEGTEHAYIRKQEWIDERNARIAEVAALKMRVRELEAGRVETCSGTLDYNSWFICSNCGCQTQGDQYGVKPNYCASCGAKVVMP